MLIGAGVDSSDWSERQVVMILAKDACDEKAGGLAGGEKREGCSREWVECDASQGSADGRSIVASFDYLVLNNKDAKYDRSDYCCCLVQRAKGEAVVGVWCDCDWDRRRG